MKIGIVTANRSERGILESLKKQSRQYEWIEIPLQFDKAYRVVRGARADCVVLFGDRPEQLAAAVAAAELGITIAHIHGGDYTASVMIDERIRPAISCFADIHFAACRDSAERLFHHGVDINKIHNVGSPAIDGCVKIKKSSPRRVIIYNPYPNENLTGEIIKEAGRDALYLKPNGDPGSEDILRVYKAHGIKPVELPRPKLLSILAHPKSELWGNSSAMYIEGSYFGTKYKQFGQRNLGRQYGGYGNGKSCKKITEILNDKIR